MKIGIMQPYFFPYLGYWQLLNAVDKYVIYDDVNYISRGWVNRNNILLNGQPHLITLPLEGASIFSPINKIKITSDLKAKEKILKTVDCVYRKSPYFNQVFPMVKSVVMEETLLLSKALEKQFNLVKSYLGIKTELIVSSQMDKDCSLKGQDKIIHICQKLGGTEYINAIGGQELYNPKDFEKEELRLYFLKTNFSEYKQFKNKFVPGLSMIDIMMFNSPQQINEMLNKYELIVVNEKQKNTPHIQQRGQSEKNRLCKISE